MLDKTIIYSIIYFISIIIIDKSKITKKYKFEPLKLLNYTIWVILSTISYCIPKYRSELMPFCSSTVVTNFAYETIYHPEDFWHNFHHLMTIFTILFSYIFGIKEYKLMCQNIYYVAFISSIFSSIRKLIKTKFGIDDIRTIIAYHIYRVTYILAKGWGIYAHYKHIIPIFPFIDKVLVSVCFIIHLIQLLFIYKMVKKT